MISRFSKYRAAFCNTKKILITSALPYVNNVPHLGNVIGCVLSADVFARYMRSAGEQVLFVCGTDEYGTATEVKAKQESTSPQAVCDKYHSMHSKAYEWFNISFDVFGRTSTPTHTRIVQDVFNRLDSNGFISENSQEQHFCQSCDMFLADRYVKGDCPKCGAPNAKGDQCDSCNQLLTATELKNAQCIQCNQTPQIKTTKHLYLDLHLLQKQVETWLDKSSTQWTPNARAIANSWLKQGLRSRSITRDLKWGVPVPKSGYTNKVFYVWFDAPLGYVSLTAEKLGDDYKRWWESPETTRLYQFMGKDNVPFHALMFPATQLGSSTNSEWTLVNRICATQYLKYEGTKFSKSNNTGVFCDNLKTTQIQCFVWRYYLLSIRPQRADANFEWEEFAHKVNSELIGNIGNLFNRVLNLVFRAPKSTLIPKLSQEEHVLFEEWRRLLIQYTTQMKNVELKEALKTVLQIGSTCNKYIQQKKPWEKQVQASGEAQKVLFVSLCGLRLLRSILEPFIPDFVVKTDALLGASAQIKQYLMAADDEHKFREYILNNQIDQQKIQTKPAPLVKAITEEEWKKFKATFG